MSDQNFLTLDGMRNEGMSVSDITNRLSMDDLSEPLIIPLSSLDDLPVMDADGNVLSNANQGLVPERRVSPAIASASASSLSQRREIVEEKKVAYVYASMEITPVRIEEKTLFDHRRLPSEWKEIKRVFPKNSPMLKQLNSSLNSNGWPTLIFPSVETSLATTIESMYYQWMCARSIFETPQIQDMSWWENKNGESAEDLMVITLVQEFQESSDQKTREEIYHHLIHWFVSMFLSLKIPYKDHRGIQLEPNTLMLNNSELVHMNQKITNIESFMFLFQSEIESMYLTANDTATQTGLKRLLALKHLLHLWIEFHQLGNHPVLNIEPDDPMILEHISHRIFPDLPTDRGKWLLVNLHHRFQSKTIDISQIMGFLSWPARGLEPESIQREAKVKISPHLNHTIHLWFMYYNQYRPQIDQVCQMIDAPAHAALLQQYNGAKPNEAVSILHHPAFSYAKIHHWPYADSLVNGHITLVPEFEYWIARLDEGVRAQVKTLMKTLTRVAKENQLTYDVSGTIPSQIDIFMKQVAQTRYPHQLAELCVSCKQLCDQLVYPIELIIPFFYELFRVHLYFQTAPYSLDTKAILFKKEFAEQCRAITSKISPLNLTADQVYWLCEEIKTQRLDNDYQPWLTRFDRLAIWDRVADRVWQFSADFIKGLVQYQVWREQYRWTGEWVDNHTMKWKDYRFVPWSILMNAHQAPPADEMTAAIRENHAAFWQFCRESMYLDLLDHHHYLMKQNNLAVEKLQILNWIIARYQQAVSLTREGGRAGSRFELKIPDYAFVQHDNHSCFQFWLLDTSTETMFLNEDLMFQVVSVHVPDFTLAQFREYMVNLVRSGIRIYYKIDRNPSRGASKPFRSQLHYAGGSNPNRDLWRDETMTAFVPEQIIRYLLRNSSTLVDKAIIQHRNTMKKTIWQQRSRTGGDQAIRENQRFTHETSSANVLWADYARANLLSQQQLNKDQVVEAERLDNLAARQQRKAWRDENEPDYTLPNRDNHGEYIDRKIFDQAVQLQQTIVHEPKPTLQSIIVDKLQRFRDEGTMSRIKTQLIPQTGDHQYFRDFFTCRLFDARMRLISPEEAPHIDDSLIQSGFFMLRGAFVGSEQIWVPFPLQENGHLDLTTLLYVGQFVWSNIFWSRQVKNQQQAKVPFWWGQERLDFPHNDIVLVRELDSNPTEEKLPRFGELLIRDCTERNFVGHPLAEGLPLAQLLSQDPAAQILYDPLKAQFFLQPPHDDDLLYLITEQGLNDQVSRKYKIIKGTFFRLAEPNPGPLTPGLLVILWIHQDRLIMRPPPNNNNNNNNNDDDDNDAAPQVLFVDRWRIYNPKGITYDPFPKMLEKFWWYLDQNTLDELKQADEQARQQVPEDQRPPPLFEDQGLLTKPTVWVEPKSYRIPRQIPAITNLYWISLTQPAQETQFGTGNPIGSFEDDDDDTEEKKTNASTSGARHANNWVQQTPSERSEYVMQNFSQRFYEPGVWLSQDATGWQMLSDQRVRDLSKRFPFLHFLGAGYPCFMTKCRLKPQYMDILQQERDQTHPTLSVKVCVPHYIPMAMWTRLYNLPSMKEVDGWFGWYNGFSFHKISSKVYNFNQVAQFKLDNLQTAERSYDSVIRDNYEIPWDDEDIKLNFKIDDPELYLRFLQRKITTRYLSSNPHDIPCPPGMYKPSGSNICQVDTSKPCLPGHFKNPLSGACQPIKPCRSGYRDRNGKCNHRPRRSCPKGKIFDPFVGECQNRPHIRGRVSHRQQAPFSLA
jgi:hypothetical protein